MILSENMIDFNKLLAEVTPQSQGSPVSTSTGGQSNELYIFTPVSFKDHASAKLLYMFGGIDSHFNDGKIANIVQIASNTGGDLTSGFNSYLNDDAFRYFSLDRNLENPERTSHLSDLYSFVYISHLPGSVTDANQDTNILSRTDLRIITYGFFHDTPVGMGHSDTNKSYNYAAKLIPTHKTVMNVMSAHNTFGSNIDYRLMLDTDIYNDEFSKLIIDASQDGKSYLTPHDPNQYIGPNVNQSKHVSTNFIDPKTHMTRFVKGLSNLFSAERFSRDTSMSGFVGGSEDAAFDGIYERINNNSTKQNLIQAFDIDKQNLDFYNNYTHVHDFGLTTLGDLILKFNANICVLNSDNSNFVNNSAETYTKNHKHNFTSMLASISNVFMNQNHLSSIAFRYSSYEDVFEIIGEPPQFIVTLDNEKMKTKIDNFIFLIKNRMFGWIRKDLGEFELSASLNVHGNSYIKLDPLAYKNFKDEYVAIPSIAGGLSVPILGDISEVHNNDEQVDLLSNIISDEADLKHFQ